MSHCQPGNNSNLEEGRLFLLWNFRKSIILPPSRISMFQIVEPSQHTSLLLKAICTLEDG